MLVKSCPVALEAEKQRLLAGVLQAALAPTSTTGSFLLSGRFVGCDLMRDYAVHFAHLHTCYNPRPGLPGMASRQPSIVEVVSSYATQRLSSRERVRLRGCHCHVAACWWVTQRQWLCGRPS